MGNFTKFKMRITTQNEDGIIFSIDKHKKEGEDFYFSTVHSGLKLSSFFPINIRELEKEIREYNGEEDILSYLRKLAELYNNDHNEEDSLFDGFLEEVNSGHNRYLVIGDENNLKLFDSDSNQIVDDSEFGKLIKRIEYSNDFFAGLFEEDQNLFLKIIDFYSGDILYKIKVFNKNKYSYNGEGLFLTEKEVGSRLVESYLYFGYEEENNSIVGIRFLEDDNDEFSEFFRIKLNGVKINENTSIFNCALKDNSLFRKTYLFKVFNSENGDLSSRNTKDLSYFIMLENGDGIEIDLSKYKNSRINLDYSFTDLFRQNIRYIVFEVLNGDKSNEEKHKLYIGFNQLNKTYEEILYFNESNSSSSSIDEFNRIISERNRL